MSLTFSTLKLTPALVCFGSRDVLKLQCNALYFQGLQQWPLAKGHVILTPRETQGKRGRGAGGGVPGALG